jgi:GTP diphosphokinase / guanosine-3',5'-bis(diphosphate) 3'-diphosphatase
MPPADPLAMLPEAAAYLSEADQEAFVRAYHYSAAAHEGQFRKGGAPYITHPLAVAEILASWHLDAQTLIAALLHDVVEDTGISSEEIANEFGKPVAQLVDGVTKLDKIQFEDKAQAQAENFRKMLLAMARDVRVILIKLADRLHNMRTLEAMQPEKGQPHRAGNAGNLRAHRQPPRPQQGLSGTGRYRLRLSASESLQGDRESGEIGARQPQGSGRQDQGRDRSQTDRMQYSAQIRGREKHLYSIYRKMQEKHLAFSEVFDIYGFASSSSKRATVI